MRPQRSPDLKKLPNAVDPTPLFTARLLLRPYEAADAPVFFALLDENQSRLRASFPDRLQAVRTLAEAPAALAAFEADWRTGRFYVFGIWHRATQTYIGDICLMPQQAQRAEIGYYLAASAEGQGYAREALAAIVQFGFETVAAGSLLIRCFADNVRGQAVAQAVGFRQEAAPPRFAWFRNADKLSNIRRFLLQRDGLAV